MDGLTLLEDNIEVTLPLAMTEDEIEAMGADIDAAKYDEASGKYCYYDLTYTVGNSRDITFPMTGMGNTARKWFPLFADFGLAGVASMIAFKKKKRREA